METVSFLAALAVMTAFYVVMTLKEQRRHDRELEAIYRDWERACPERDEMVCAHCRAGAGR